MADDNRDLTIERYTDGIDFPANQDAVINHLRRRNAPGPMVERIQELPKEEFKDAADLKDAFHDSGKWRGTMDRTGEGL